MLCQNVFLHNWKEWVMHQTKCCHNVIMISVSGREKNKIRFMKQMLPDIKHIILMNINVKLYSWPLTFREVVSAETDLSGGGSFECSFLQRYFLNLTVKKYEKCCRSYHENKSGLLFETRIVYLCCTSQSDLKVNCLSRPPVVPSRVEGHHRKVEGAPAFCAPPLSTCFRRHW